MNPLEISTREKIEEVRNKIDKKSKQIVTVINGDVEMIPLENYWSNYRDIEIKEVDYNCKDASTAIVKAKKGSLIDIHYHLKKEILYVISGKIKETLTDRKINRGKTIEFSRKEKHGIEFLEDTTLLLQWIH